MTPADTLGEREEEDALAAEYVLGLLEPDERRRLEDRLAGSASLRAAVARWGEDLASLLDDVAPVAPPAGVEAALMRRLFPQARRGWLAPGRLIPSLLGGLAAALLVLWLVDPGLLTRAPEGPVLAATVAAEDGSIRVAARFEPGAEVVEVRLEAGAAPAGRVLQLWLLPEGGQGAPESLGVLPEGGGTLPVPEALREAVAGGVLAISDEPPGGSPEAGPTGSVLATGPVTTL